MFLKQREKELGSDASGWYCSWAGTEVYFLNYFEPNGFSVKTDRHNSAGVYNWSRCIWSRWLSERSLRLKKILTGQLLESPGILIKNCVTCSHSEENQVTNIYQNKWKCHHGDRPGSGREKLSAVPPSSWSPLAIIRPSHPSCARYQTDKEPSGWFYKKSLRVVLIAQVTIKLHYDFRVMAALS